MDLLSGQELNRPPQKAKGGDHGGHCPGTSLKEKRERTNELAQTTAQVEQ